MALAVGGCGEKPGAPADASSPAGGQDTGFSQTTILKQVYDVEYADGVAVIDDATMAMLLSASDGVLKFAPAARGSLALSPGQVVVFSGHSIGRITSVDDSAAGIAVFTTPALFTEAYRNADIRLETRITWREPVSTARVGRFALISSAVAAEPWKLSRSFELKGVKFDASISPVSADRLEFEINTGLSPAARMKSITPFEAARSVPTQSISANDVLDPDARMTYGEGSSGSPAISGAASADVAKVKASGHISGFEQALHILVRDSRLQKFDFLVRDLKGEIRVEGAGLKDAAGSFDLTMPLEYSIPMAVGPVPVVWKLGMTIKLTPQVHAGSAKFCFTASYSGTTGLSFESGSLKNQSNVSQRTATLCGSEETVSAGPVTVGFGATANIPEISLQIFGNTIVPGVGLNFGGVTLYEPGLINARQACQSGNTELKAIVKIALSFFGVGIENEHMLWQRKKEWNCDGSTTETTFDPVNGAQTETRPAEN